MQKKLPFLLCLCVLSTPAHSARHLLRPAHTQSVKEHTFHGLQIGLLGGYGSAVLKNQSKTLAFSKSLQSIPGFLFGVEMGYGGYLAGKVYTGFFARYKKNTGRVKLDDGTLSGDESWSTGARLGYSVNRSLIYCGAAYSNTRFKKEGFVDNVHFPRKSYNGARLSLGLDTLVSPWVIIGIEGFLTTHFGEADDTGKGADPRSTRYSHGFLMSLKLKFPNK